MEIPRLHESMNRRRFLDFLGRSSACAFLSPHFSWAQESAEKPSLKKEPQETQVPFQPLGPSFRDDVVLAEGLSARILVGYSDKIGPGIQFGYDNDFLAFQSTGPQSGWLFVNHESVNPVLTAGASRSLSRTKAQVDHEMSAIGCSLVMLRKTQKGGWTLDPDTSRNRRWDANTPIPFAWDEPIAGAKIAKGTLSNCAGGQTPWGTFLTAEENYQNHYGEVSFEDGRRTVSHPARSYGWYKFEERPPEHYGWIVEMEPKTGVARKLVALGRFGHEGATVVPTKDGRVVVYSGDDKAGGCIYKFIASSPRSLANGTLYVADVKNGLWQPLNMQNPRLKKHFRNQTELLIRTREAALLAGGTPMDRPEDIEQDPATGAILCALTNNKEAGNLFGSLFRIDEFQKDPLALKFSSDTFIVGGASLDFACPDNLAFDKKGNLWVTTDVSDPDIGKGPYKPFGHNSLFYIPMSGPLAGRPYRVASAPVEAEFTGPCFTPDGTLLLSVQHPGNQTTDARNATSHWPAGGNSTPRPAVICIEGPLLERLLT